MTPEAETTGMCTSCLRKGLQGWEPGTEDQLGAENRPKDQTSFSDQKERKKLARDGQIESGSLNFRRTYLGGQDLGWDGLGSAEKHRNLQFTCIGICTTL